MQGVNQCTAAAVYLLYYSHIQYIARPTPPPSLYHLCSNIIDIRINTACMDFNPYYLI